MNVLVKAEVGAVLSEVKAVNMIKVTPMKTKTKLEVKMDGNTPDSVDTLSGEIIMLKADGEKLMGMTVTVEGAPAFGRIINRAVLALGKIGVDIHEIDWEAQAGVVAVSGNISGYDFPMIVDVFRRLSLRACATMGHTHHPLSLFDLKQATGLTYDLSQGTSKDLGDWFDVRELTVLEAAKAEKKAAKAQAKTEKKKAKPEVEKATGTAKNAKKTASLGNLK
jgi:hypothetical protein